MMDTGQFLTYLFIYALPTIIHLLIDRLTPRKSTISIFLILAKPPWLLQGNRQPVTHRRIKQFKKPVVSKICMGNNISKRLQTFNSYLKLSFNSKY